MMKDNLRNKKENCMKIIRFNSNVKPKIKKKIKISEILLNILQVINKKNFFVIYKIINHFM